MRAMKKSLIKLVVLYLIIYVAIFLSVTVFGMGNISTNYSIRELIILTGGVAMFFFIVFARIMYDHRSAELDNKAGISRDSYDV